jgi:hypothetical protein
VYQFLSVPSKCQTRGSVLEQLSLPCPETTKYKVSKVCSQFNILHIEIELPAYLSFIFFVQILKLITPAISQPWSFIRAKQ